jgi:Pyridoxal-phosphate dependent enzyme
VTADTTPAFRLAAQEYDPAIDVATISEHPGNPNEGDTGVLDESLAEHGFYGAILVQRSTRYILAGNHRHREAVAAGATTLPGFWLDVDDEQAAKIMAVDNESTRRGRTNAAALVALLRPMTDLRGSGYTEAQLAALLRGEGGAPGGPHPRLADRFLIAPFDVLDARQGWWRDRKRAWLGLGLRSEIGRGGELAVTNAGAYDPSYYDQKDAAEARTGRTLSEAEFRDRYYTNPGKGINAGGTSVFDPVLCELAYRWFSPPCGHIIDPFAGGSVRGLVAAMLGRAYTGCDLSAAQVAANEQAAADFAARGLLAQPEPAPLYGPHDPTPVEEHGGHLVKRDDLYTVGGSAGGKVRTCLALAHGATGLVTAGSRQSPQVNIVATIAEHLGLPCAVHVPAAAGPLTPELLAAKAAGALIIEHRPGHNSVIKKRAADDAARRGWRLVPFGMECQEAVEQTASQVASLPFGDFTRLVVPVGSGMSLAGIMYGLQAAGHPEIEVLGVVVGADPVPRLTSWAPVPWQHQATLVHSEVDYHAEAPVTRLGGLQLDPIYEAKCLPYLESGDLLWVVGCRETARPAATVAPTWVVGDAVRWAPQLPYESADLVFTCPPYFDPEAYSDDPADLSAMSDAEFGYAMHQVLEGCAQALRPDRFAVVVCGDARNSRGVLRDMRGVVIQAAAVAGLTLASAAVYVPPLGAIRITAGRVFQATRTLARTHQDVLVFAKGSRAAAAAACGHVDVTVPDELAEQLAGTTHGEGEHDVELD